MLNNLKIALRHLLKNKFFSSLNIAGLAVGLAVSLVIGLWIWDEISHNAYNSKADRVAAVMQNMTIDGKVETWWNQSKNLAPVLRTEYGSHFEQVVTTSHLNTYPLSKGDKTLNRRGCFAELGMAELLELEMLHGNWASLSDATTILISAPTAEAFFGTTDVVGESIALEENDLFTIGGVFASLPQNSTYGNMDFLGGWDYFNQGLPEWLGWGNNWFEVLVAVKSSEQLAEVSTLIKDIKYDRITEKEGKRFKPQLFLHPMSNWYLYSKFENGVAVGGRISNVRALSIIGLIVLLLACINFMNLATARSEKRSLEVGIRKTMGSRRGQLIGQFYSESILLSFMGGVIALGLTLFALPLFNVIAEKELVLPIEQTGFWMIFTVICLVSGLLAGSYPALYLSSFSPIRIMKNTKGTNQAQHRPRQALVVLQFAVSVVLIIGTIVVNQQIQHAKDRPIGFQEDGLIGIPLRGEQLINQFDAFREELLQTGKISAVGKSDNAITSTHVNNSGLSWEGKPADFQDEFVTIRVDPDFGKTLDWEMQEGRDFSREHPSDSLAFVINEAAAKYLAFDDPIGQRIEWGEGEFYTIIGVVKDMLTQSPYRPVKQTLFFLDKNRTNYATMRIAPTTSTGAALMTVEQVFKQYDPINNFEYQLISEEHAKKFGEEERTGKLISIFALLAIFISCLGLFGMAAYVAERRTKEIGIRKVLGASVANLVSLITTNFLILVIAALVLAIPLAYYLVSLWLAEFPYRIELQWWMFAGAGLMAIALAMLTVGVQSLRAALSNPIEAIRTE